MQPNFDRAWALFIARALLGIVFFIAGVHKVFTIGALEHARRLFVVPYAGTYLPEWSLWLTGTATPVLELVFGALVLIGLFTRPALLVLGGILVMVAFGHLVLSPLFVMNGFILPRSGLLLFVLLLPREWDLFSVDALRRRRRQPRAQEALA
ncbi:MAG: DoxX family protein [Vicinamibacterales bacterium]